MPPSIQSGHATWLGPNIPVHRVLPVARHDKDRPSSLQHSELTRSAASGFYKARPPRLALTKVLVHTMLVFWAMLLWAGTAFGLPASQFEVAQLNAQTPLQFQSLSAPGKHKRIAIVGTGAAGITQLKVITEMPAEMRQGWEIAVFEERGGVGGIWFVAFLCVSYTVADESLTWGHH